MDQGKNRGRDDVLPVRRRRASASAVQGRPGHDSPFNGRDRYHRRAIRTIKRQRKKKEEKEKIKRQSDEEKKVGRDPPSRVPSNSV